MIDYNITASGILLGLFYMAAMMAYFEAKFHFENKGTVHPKFFIGAAVTLALFWIIININV